MLMVLHAHKNQLFKDGWCTALAQEITKKEHLNLWIHLHVPCRDGKYKSFSKKVLRTLQYTYLQYSLVLRFTCIHTDYCTLK